MATNAKRTNIKRREESREKILDAAERLFAQGGFNGVSTKQIAQAGEFDASLMHYYFENKEGLFRAVIERRAESVNRIRLESLKRYSDEAGETVTVEGVLRAYLEPTFAYVMAGGNSFKDYLSIIAHVNSTPAAIIPGFETSPFDPAVREFLSMIGRAAPDRTEAEIFWFYHMLSGAITLTWARTGRIDALSEGLCRSDDLESACREMIAVFADGLSRGRC